MEGKLYKRKETGKWYMIFMDKDGVKWRKSTKCKKKSLAKKVLFETEKEISKG